MRKIVRRLLNRIILNKRRLFRLLLITWLTIMCAVLLKNTYFPIIFREKVISIESQGTRTSEMPTNISIDSLLEQNFSAAENVTKQQSEAQVKQVKDFREMDTVGGFIKRAESDTSFLQRMLDQPFLHSSSVEVITSFLTGEKYLGFENDLKEDDLIKRQLNYDINSDVAVFLHIQKTGGTRLNQRFMTDLQLPFKCACSVKLPCSCRSEKGTVWMYTSVFAGWPCGLHADWTQLHRCIPGQIDKMEGNNRQRRYFYFTQLRNPIDRYISEWRHQSNGHHWQDAILGCGDGYSDWADIRPCFHGNSWAGVTLNDFMNCPHNLATNRQARMLADLTLTNCYRNFASHNTKLQRAVGWVKSAIDNLKHMEYFGLMEEGKLSDDMFFKTFGLKFRKDNILTNTKTSSYKLTEGQFKKILGLVELDIHIYIFAKELFLKRQQMLN